MNKWKKLSIEVAVIVIVSLLFSIVYNLLSPNPLPFIKQEKIIKVVSDSALMSLVNIDTTKAKELKPVQQQVTATVKQTEDGKQKDSEIITKKEQKKTESAEQPQNPDKSELMTLSYSQLLKLMKNPNVLLIDARGSEEYQKGHLPGAINIYAYEPDQNVYFSTITKLDNNKLLIVYCDGGHCDASHKLSADIMSFGYKKVYLYNGGWEEWTQKQSGK